MGLPRFIPVHTQDKTLKLIQERIAATLNPLLEFLPNGGKTLLQVQLKTGTNLVAHGLGRTYQSFWAFHPSAIATVTEGTSPDPSKYILFTASAPLSFDLVVF